jgi:hypothetical protein
MNNIKRTKKEEWEGWTILKWITISTIIICFVVVICAVLGVQSPIQ